MARTNRRRSATLLLVGLLLITMAACDSGGSDPEPSDVAGTYDFTELRFRPNAYPAIAEVSLLDTLTTASLVLTSYGRYILEYRFVGAQQYEVAEGEFSVSDDWVRLSAESEGAAEVFDMILLPQEVRLDRLEGRVLVEEITQRNPGFDVSRYLDGANDLGGTLYIRLED